IFFFFQAEDGIRDFHVTGVQTCALPISRTLDILLPRKVSNAKSLEGLSVYQWIKMGMQPIEWRCRPVNSISKEKKPLQTSVRPKCYWQCYPVCMRCTMAQMG